MKAATKEALKRHALAVGARLELDGRVVNSARAHVARQPREPAPPTAAPAPAYMPPVPEKAPPETIPPVDSVVREVAVAIERITSCNVQSNEASAKLLQGLAEAIKELCAREPEKRPVRWVFEIKRDAHSLMERIEATAVFK